MVCHIKKHLKIFLVKSVQQGLEDVKRYRMDEEILKAVSSGEKQLILKLSSHVYHDMNIFGVQRYLESKGFKAILTYQPCILTISGWAN
ncbi:MAG: hypothetical protein BWY74_01820 [Firmicutes bacterium ADurb.Bin419]|nr:MAG: hypothetical protein BWY74_01820 [Firmicutes bacterium ADurb.Bin419]